MGTPRIHTLVDTIWELTCPDNNDYMAGEAEKTLASSAYHSKERNLTFEKCALLHLNDLSVLAASVHLLNFLVKEKLVGSDMFR